MTSKKPPAKPRERSAATLVRWTKRRTNYGTDVWTASAHGHYAFVWSWSGEWCRLQLSSPNRRLRTFRSLRTLDQAKAIAERELRSALPRARRGGR